jgi:hypothetical protein
VELSRGFVFKEIQPKSEKRLMENISEYQGEHRNVAGKHFAFRRVSQTDRIASGVDSRFNRLHGDQGVQPGEPI